MEKCPSYRGVRLTIVRLIEVFLWETHLHSAGTCGSVRLREVSVLWDVRLKRFHCTNKVLCISRIHTQWSSLFITLSNLDDFFEMMLRFCTESRLSIATHTFFELPWFHLIHVLLFETWNVIFLVKVEFTLSDFYLHY